MANSKENPVEGDPSAVLRERILSVRMALNELERNLGQISQEEIEKLSKKLEESAKLIEDLALEGSDPVFGYPGDALPEKDI